MLKTRIITAVLLLSAFLCALFVLPPAGWVMVATLVATVAAWEWGGLLHLGKIARLVLALVFLLVCATIVISTPASLGLENVFSGAAWSLGRWLYVPSAAFWLLVVPIWMRMHWPLTGMVKGLFVGFLVLLPTWLAFVQLRQAGHWPLLAVMAVPWIADIAAYFCGRAFGRHKLAPKISPGKTWEGAIGGGVGVVLYGAFVLSPIFFPAIPGLHVFFFLIVLTVISVIGDLFESMLKRQAGIKDSSNILPGHGGVLDRIDSLTSTLPLVALVWLNTIR